MSIDPTTGASSQSFVTAALKNAGHATGVSFDFLLKMAKRESSLNPAAKAQTSSAAGLFQFIEQTWLSAVKTHGAKHGLGDFAADITRNTHGRYKVQDAARREEILDLRFDAAASAALAGELANDNKRALEAKLGRGVSNAELYTAHFLGAGGAATLLSADDTESAAALLPKAAAANRHVFYDGVRARTVGDVMASIARSMGDPAPETKNWAAAFGFQTAAAGAAASRLREGVSFDARTDRGQPIEAVWSQRFEQAGVQQPITDSLPTAVSVGVASRSAEPAALAGSRLSALALSVLQALDPTRLTSARNERRDV